MEKDYTIAVKGRKKIVFEGNLVLKNIEKIHKELPQQVFSNNAEILISNVSDIDLTFYQLLISLKKKNENIKKIEIYINQQFEKLAINAGLNNYFKFNH